MATGIARVRGIDIWYETFGARADPAVLLVMGAGMQAPVWPDPFCEALARRGRFVVRYDNRDVGLSTWLDQLPADPDALRGAAPYTRDDMASDARGLLDALGVERAHLVGASLGATIAEALVARAPDRALSVTMFGGMPVETRERYLAYWDAFEEAPPQGRDERIGWRLAASRAAAGTGGPFEEERMRALWSALVEREWHPAGWLRQRACAYFSDRPGPAAFRRTGVPLLVVEGTDDPGFEGMRAYAAEVPGARFVALEGVGHELPSRAWDPIVEAVAPGARTSSGSAAGPR